MDNIIELKIRVDDLLKSNSSSIPEIQKDPQPQQPIPLGTAEERFDSAQPKESGFTTTGKALAMGAVGTAISNVGTLTGSQAAQNQANNATKIIGLGAVIVKNPLLGIGMLALTIANNAIKIAKETREWNLAESRNSERIGMIASQRGRR